MINLLPDDYKKEISAARSNVVLRNYNLITIAAALLLFVGCGLFYVILSQNKNAAEADNLANIKEASKYDATRRAAEDYSKNLATAKKILDNDTSYTSIIFKLTSLLPKDVVLDSLNLSGSSFGSQTVLAAHAKNYEAIALLKKQLQESKFLSNVYFQSITKANGQAAGAYPISVNISVTINKAALKGGVQ